MKRRDVLVGTSVLATPLVAGCLGQLAEPTETPTPAPRPGASSTSTPSPDSTSTDGRPGTPTERPTRTVEIDGQNFHPRRPYVKVGTTVEWVNRDNYGHRVHSAKFSGSAVKWSFDSGRLGPGESATRTFDERGQYEFLCTIHGRDLMCGAVRVEVSLSDTLPCEE